MPDGNRKRRHSDNEAKRRWYAQHRARRFRRRFWSGASKPDHLRNVPSPHLIWAYTSPAGATV